ncbi:hypothetical protein HPPC_01710 [Helicobacter pylori PeCan4]|nr:hypothetical protein HPPC_01710 [Helicobacter pylori PeCan4]
MRGTQKIENRGKKHAIISPRNYRPKALFWGLGYRPNAPYSFKKAFY